MTRIGTKTARKFATELLDKAIEHKYGTISRISQLEMTRVKYLHIYTIEEELNTGFHSEASKNPLN